jgi:hypothetical protein
MTIYCIAGVVDTGEQLIASVVDTGKKYMWVKILNGPQKNWFVKKSEVENQNNPLKFKKEKKCNVSFFLQTIHRA